MKTIFETKMAWLAHEILRKLDRGETALQGFDSELVNQVIKDGVIRDLVREGFLDEEAAITRKGRFAVAYPHLAANVKGD